VKTNMSKNKTIFEKADVINFAAIVSILLIVTLVAVYIIFAFLSETPLEVLSELKNWVIPIISAIFLAYGITRKE